MKISELVAELEVNWAEHGDLDVLMDGEIEWGEPIFGVGKVLGADCLVIR